MFIDANVFIMAYLNSQERGKRARAFLAKIARGEQNAITSALVLNEVFNTMLDLKGMGKVESAHRNLQSYAHLTIMPIDVKVAGESLAYMKEGLETSDAFHAATMKIAGVGTICSFDRDFDRLKAKGIKRQEP